MSKFQPNILIILTEDLSPHSATYGETLSAMNAVDAIAKDAIIFENAFCSSPVCSPSRFSMITGMEPASVGPAMHMRGDAVVPASVKLITKPLQDEGYYCLNVGKADYNFEPDMKATWHDSSMSAHWRNRASDQPFFAFFNLVETHESSIFREQVTLVTADQIELPPYLPDTPEIREDFARYYTAMQKSNDHIAQILDELEHDGLADQTVIIQISDHGGSTPRSKRFIYDSGAKVPLVIKIPESMRSSRIWREPQSISTAVSLIDLAPTVFDIAGGLPAPDTMIGKSLLSVAPADDDQIVFSGRDRMDENYDMIRSARTSRYLYVRNYFPNRPWLQNQAFAWQAKGYQSWETEFLAQRTDEMQSRYFGTKPAEEFYDNHADPHQVNNLIGESEFSATIQRFRDAIDSRIMEIFDNGFIPENSPIEGLPNSRNPRLYPLAEVLHLANLTIHGDATNLPTFVAALKKDNEVLRFWGAQGLLMLGQNAMPALVDIVEALTDSNGHVKAIIAECLARLEHRDLAIGAYQQLLTSSSTYQVLIRAAKSAASIEPKLAELSASVKTLLQQLRTDDFEDQGYFNAYTGLRYLDLTLEGKYVPSAQVFDLELFMKRLQKNNPNVVKSMSTPRN